MTADVNRRPDPDIARDALTVIRGALGTAADGLRVVVDDGWITIGGHVEQAHHRAQAESALRWLRGVRGIRNRIRVVLRPNTTATPDAWVPWVHIHRARPTPMQSTAERLQLWLLEFVPSRSWPEPLRFSTCGSAVRFAQQQGWTYVIEDAADGPVQAGSQG